MYLIYLEWTIAGKSYNNTVKLDGEKTIGRNRDNTFVIDDRQVSGTQAKINDVAGKVVITNVSKNNNIQVGTQIVNKNGGAAQLLDKVTIQMGGTSLYTRLTAVTSETVDYVKCTTCARPVPSGTDVCPWCNSPQTGTEASYTMA